MREKLWSRLPVLSLNAHMNSSTISADAEQSPIKASLCPCGHRSAHRRELQRRCLVLLPCEHASRDASGWRMGADFCSQAGGGELKSAQLLIFDIWNTSAVWDRHLRFSSNESLAGIAPGFHLTKLVAVVAQAICKHAFCPKNFQLQRAEDAKFHTGQPKKALGTPRRLSNSEWAGITEMPNSPRSPGSGRVPVAPGNGRRLFCI